MAADTSLADADYPKPRAALPGSGAMRVRIARRRLDAGSDLAGWNRLAIGSVIERGALAVMRKIGAQAPAATTLMPAENHAPQAPLGH